MGDAGGVCLPLLDNGIDDVVEFPEGCMTPLFVKKRINHSTTYATTIAP